MPDTSELFGKYLNLSFRYLTICNRSEKQIREYLTKKEAKEEIIDKIVHVLKEKKFLNDETFARAWVLNRARLKPKGNMLLKIELRQKGIADDLIAKVLSEVKEEIPDELEQARNLISGRMEKVKNLSRQEMYQKFGGFLARRGFSWDITKKAIDSYLSKD